MKHATVRRFSLLFAGISLSAFALLLLLVNCFNIIDPTILRKDQESGKAPVFSQQSVLLPYKIEGTPLTLEAICTYSGLFYEDGTGREVSDILAVRVCNNGTKMVLYGLIELHFANQTFLFEVTRVAPGTTVLIPEKNASDYFVDMPSQCCGWTIDKSYLMRQDVEVLSLSGGGFVVTNKSDRDIKGLNIYHKLFLPEEDLYVGGIAHRTFIMELKAGETILIEQASNISGYSILFYE